MMASDNILSYDKYFADMIAPILNGSRVDFSYSRYYAYNKSIGHMSRYFAILGGNDPLSWYLGRNDKDEYDYTRNNTYSIKRFDEHDLPTIGDNGFFISARAMAEVDLEKFYHIDAIYDLVKANKYNKFAVFNNAIIHDTGEQFFKYLRKRFKYVNNLYLKEIENRRFHLVRKDNVWGVVSFVFYSISFVGFVWSFKKFKRFKDISVFIHPFLCLGLCLVYGYGLLSKTFMRGQR